MEVVDPLDTDGHSQHRSTLLNSVLDFRFAEGVFGDDDNAPLRDLLKGFKGPQTLFNRIEAQRNRALDRGEIGRYLVTFVDNHDSFWQPTGRFANGATDDQVIGAIAPRVNENAG
jgi:alpha-amylase